MATYMRETLKRRTIRNAADVRSAIYDAGVKRIRPCMMTTVTTLVALVPVLISTGRGADVARAMALPIFGGMLIEPFTTSIVPTLYSTYVEFKMRAGLQDEYWREGGAQIPTERINESVVSSAASLDAKKKVR